MDVRLKGELRVQYYTWHPGKQGGTDSCAIDIDGEVNGGGTGERVDIIVKIAFKEVV